MISYLTIDDEHIAHEIIKGYCDKTGNMQLARHCYDAIEALEYLREHKVDLIFLDINMPKLKGFEFLRTLSQPPKVIVTTAYQEYALEGYELNIIDYLLKPFSFERFLKAVNKATSSQPDNSNDKTETEPKTDQIFLYTDKKYFQVAIADILYVEAAGNYVKVITGKETYVVRDKLSDLVAKLPKDQFIQVHKSFVIARQHIHSIEGNRIHILDHVIPVGKTYKHSLGELFK